MKAFAIVACYFLQGLSTCFGQNSSPRLELYAAPGLFLEQLNSDSLVPPARRNVQRLGDVSSYALQYSVPLQNTRWILKAGLGISQRHFSLNKYSLNDFFVAIFRFDSPLHVDSFSVNYVRLSNQYFEIPLSFSYSLSKNMSSKKSRFLLGINLRPDFLLSSTATVILDSSFGANQGLAGIQKKYTANAAHVVLTVEPFVEWSFRVYKQWGLYSQLRPFSLTASRLNMEYTRSTFELFGFTFGLFYSFDKAK